MTQIDLGNTTRSISRRDALKLAGAALAAGLITPASFAAPRRSKKVIVAGGGIGGLCCAYELMKRGHEVTVLEASAHAGGHVLTGREFPDGLYADLGAEQCTDPGYELWRGYVKEFGLTLLPYRRRDNLIRFIDKKPYTDEMLADRKALVEFGFNQREVDFLARHEWADLPLLYYGPYLDKFTDEYQPFGIGLDALDEMSATEFLEREHASAATIRFNGSKTSSALHRMWFLAILKRRRREIFSKNLFRIQGGNQMLTDTFTLELGPRVRLGCAVTRIVHGNAGVTIRYRENGEEKTLEAEYLVNAIALPLLKQIPVEPAWPAAKTWVIQNVAYGMQTRVVFQCRTRFWKKDGISPNIAPGDVLSGVWECATEVSGERGILMASAPPGTTRTQALEAYRRYYSGKSMDIEKVFLQEWFRETYSPLCERQEFPVGQLKKFWPNIIQPVGRIHFVGAYADNGHHGMEAATRSANRVARQIDEA